MLLLKYAANRNMRIACAMMPCLTSPAGCCVESGAVFVRCAFSFSMTGTDTGGCRCRRPLAVMVCYSGTCVGGERCQAFCGKMPEGQMCACAQWAGVVWLRWTRETWARLTADGKQVASDSLHTYNVPHYRRVEEGCGEAWKMARPQLVPIVAGSRYKLMSEPYR